MEIETLKDLLLIIVCETNNYTINQQFSNIFIVRPPLCRVQRFAATPNKDL